MPETPRKPATYADLEAAPRHLAAEIIDGKLFTRSHGHAVPAMVRTMSAFALRDARQARSTPHAHWQMVTLPELHLGEDALVPELAAWSVARMPFLPDEHISIRPDWVCELFSDDPSRNPALSNKMEIYRVTGVRHVWIIDLSARRLSVVDNDRDTDHLIAKVDFDGEVAADPFDALSFSLADLWPLDRPLGFNEDPQALYAGDR